MFVRIERPPGAPSRNAETVGPPAQLFEIVSPRTNAASYTPIESNADSCRPAPGAARQPGPYARRGRGLCRNGRGGSDSA